MDGDRYDQGSQFLHLSEQAAAQLFDLVTARLLGIHGQAEIAPEGGDEAHGQVHSISHFIRQPKSAEDDTVMRRVKRVRDQDGHAGNAEHTDQHTERVHGFFSGDV